MGGLTSTLNKKQTGLLSQILFGNSPQTRTGTGDPETKKREDETKGREILVLLFFRIKKGI